MLCTATRSAIRALSFLYIFQPFLYILLYLIAPVVHLPTYFGYPTQPFAVLHLSQVVHSDTEHLCCLGCADKALVYHLNVFVVFGSACTGLVYVDFFRLGIIATSVAVISREVFSNPSLP